MLSPKKNLLVGVRDPLVSTVDTALSASLLARGAPPCASDSTPHSQAVHTGDRDPLLLFAVDTHAGGLSSFLRSLRQFIIMSIAGQLNYRSPHCRVAEGGV